MFTNTKTCPPTLRHTVVAVASLFTLGMVATASSTNADARTAVGVNVNVGGSGYHGGGHRGYSPRAYYGGYRGWGGWYGPRYSLGFYLPFLPIGYSSYWYGGVPYYYHDNSYFVADGGGYRVVAQPNIEAVISPPSPAPVVAASPAINSDNQPTPTFELQAKTGQLYAYPRNGQSATAATFDRIECEKWGSGQTGYQPGQSTDAQKKTDYQRAVAACLEGRGYSVR